MAKIDAKYDDFVALPLKNVKIKWAKVFPGQEDSYNNGPAKWSINVYINDKLGKDMKKAGFNVKEDDDGMYIVPKKNVLNAKGGENKAISVVDTDGRTPFVKDLGNGTLVNINISAKKWPNVAKIATYIGAIQVLEHVEYNRGAGFEDLSGTGGDVPEFA